MASRGPGQPRAQASESRRSQAGLPVERDPHQRRAAMRLAQMTRGERVPRCVRHLGTRDGALADGRLINAPTGQTRPVLSRGKLRQRVIDRDHWRSRERTRPPRSRPQ